MPAAVILICSTLVTNVPSGTEVSQVCPTDAQVEVAELTSSFDRFSFDVLSDFVEPEESAPAEAAKTPDAPAVQAKTKPVAVVHRETRPRHMRVAMSLPQHHHKSWHRAHVMATGPVEVRPDSPPSLWDTLKQLPLFSLAQNSD